MAAAWAAAVFMVAAWVVVDSTVEEWVVEVLAAWEVAASVAPEGSEVWGAVALVAPAVSVGECQVAWVREDLVARAVWEQEG
jgi:hypothetical protein